MYTFSLDQIWERFAKHLDGSRNAVILIVSFRQITDASCAALQKSFEALGYGKHACYFLSIQSENQTLDNNDLLQAIEGLDPLCVVITDAKAAEECATAYKAAVPLFERFSLLTRPALAFKNFEEMIPDGAEKHRAWALLKCLAKLDT